ncbi:MAG: dioxygenase, partial [Pseudomonadota bacterium]|nr:dioxygenase [Pseudomonadota bacterium]
MSSMLPSLFVSHGSPMIALEPGAAGAFMRRLGPAFDAAFGRPKAIVTISAHTAARLPVVLAAARHEAIYDFGGFDPRLQTLRYDAPGAPALATRVVDALAAVGIAAQRSDEGGLDHGAWTALRFLYPTADIPIVPVAFVPTDLPSQQFALGRALAPLAEAGVLILASGSITHNLGRIFRHGLRPDEAQPEIAESAAFRAWMAARAAEADWDALFAYRSRAPFAVDMHPTDEHLLPWFVAAGAGGRAAP